MYPWCGNAQFGTELRKKGLDGESGAWARRWVGRRWRTEGVVPEVMHWRAAEASDWCEMVMYDINEHWGSRCLRVRYRVRFVPWAFSGCSQVFLGILKSVKGSRMRCVYRSYLRGIGRSKPKNRHYTQNRRFWTFQDSETSSFVEFGG